MRIALLLTFVLAAAPVLAQDDIESYPYPAFEISADLSALPKAVVKTRSRLIEAARTGDIMALGPIIAAQDYPPTVSFGETDNPLDYLKLESADGAGLESLAILLDLLDAPYAIFNSDSDNPSYVWPYLAVVEDLSALTAAQKVDAYRILDHEQLTELIDMQAWYYWRVYIGKDGEWQAFVAGD